MQKKNFLLVDVSAMYFRAFYAIRHLSNSKGMPTNALYGFISMCVKMLEQFHPEYMVFCFDRKDPSFRKKIYPEYKANRGEMPEDLVPQVPYISKLAEAMGAKCLELKDYEADDIIGMLAKWGEQQDLHPVIISGDKDFAQLVSDKTNMFEPMKEMYFGPKEVEEKWGVKPEQMIDYLALVGDSSDNIPGVKGIGPKGAQKLLGEFGSLENIYKNIEKVKNKNLAKKLEENKENAFLSQELITIVTDNVIEAKDKEDFRWQGYRDEELKALLEELEFDRFLKKFFAVEEKSEDKKVERGEKLPEFSYEKLKGHFPELEHKHLPKKKILVIEDVDKFKRKDPIFAFRFQGQIYLGQEHLLLAVDEVDLENYTWQGFDIKSILRELDIHTYSIKEDLQLLAYTYSSKEVKTEEFLIQAHFSDSDALLERVEEFYLALLTINKALVGVTKKQKVYEIYRDLEISLAPILHKMEHAGIRLDLDELEAQKQDALKEVEELKSEIQKELDIEINLDSPKQLAHALFEVKGLPVIKKTKTGYSTDSEVLEKLGKDYPFCKQIIQYREIKKLLSTYIEALPKLVSSETGKIHSHFNQAVTTTGRLSSSNPNLQNIPIRSPRGGAIRKAFVADPGNKLIAADYSQIELRVLAHITEDPSLIKAFNEDIDIHALTASEVFGVALKDVHPEMRRRAKAVNFGIAYGMGAYTLAENLGISRREAKEIIDTYFQRFKNVKTYMNDIVAKAKEQGYVESIFGRRRYIEEIYSKNPSVQKFGERAAINAPMQSSASDIVKKSMILVDQQTSAEMLLQVHDELIFQCPEEKLEQQVEIIREAMESAVKLKTRLKVNIGVGENWQQAH
tara:strand:- start:2055 stop:4607 length:2553 start_codon:yes stop_codon:yes gene_type:complete